MANKKVSQLTSKPSVLVTDLFPIADPSTGQLYKTTISDLGTAIGSGVSSVNGLVGAVVLDTDDIQELVSPTNKWFTDTRARAALSASSPLAYNSGTGVFSIPAATSSQNGYLSSTDWTTFNGKQAALSGTGFVKISGTTISYDNSTYLTTSAAASTYLALAGGTLTGALIGTSAGFTGYVGIGNTSPLYQLDVTGSGRFDGDLIVRSTNPRIYLTDTDNNPDYFISNTDGTFTVYDVTNSTARFTIGTTGNATFANAITGGGSITGTALYSTGIISAGTSLSVGTTITAGSSVTATRLILSGGTSPTGLYFGHTDKVVLANYTVGGGIDFETNGGNITMQLSSAGNLSTTGSISGTSATFSDTVAINKATSVSLNVSTTASLGYGSIFLSNGDGTTSGKFSYVSFTNNQTSPQEWRAGTVGSNDFYIRNNTAGTNPLVITTAGNVGIGTTSPGYKLEVQTNSTSAGLWVQTGGTTSSYTIADFRTGTNASALALMGDSKAIFGGIVRTDNPIQVGAGSNNYYTQITTAYNYPYVDSYFDSVAGSSYEGRLNFRTSTGGGSLSTKLIINNSGTLLINKTTSANAYGLEIKSPSGDYLMHFTSANGSYNSDVYQSGGDGTVHWRNGSCDVYLPRTAGTWVGNSDSTIKENINLIDNSLSKLMQLNGYTYNLIDDKENLRAGLLAQEVEAVLPEAVHTTFSKNYNRNIKGVEYDVLIPLLVNSIKELKAELDTLKNK